MSTYTNFLTVLVANMITSKKAEFVRALMTVLFGTCCRTKRSQLLQICSNQPFILRRMAEELCHDGELERNIANSSDWLESLTEDFPEKIELNVWRDAIFCIWSSVYGFGQRCGNANGCEFHYLIPILNRLGMAKFCDMFLVIHQIGYDRAYDVLSRFAVSQLTNRNVSHEDDKDIGNMFNVLFDALREHIRFRDS